MTAVIEWRPHPGKQEKFLSSPAYECLYGGAAGPGKSECLLMGATRYVAYPDYHAVIFRRKYPDIERTLIPRSMKYFKPAGAHWDGVNRKWTWPSGAVIRFAHLQYEVSVYDHQSAEYQYVAFDELGEFTFFQYDFIKTRCRGTNPDIRLMIRSGSNPIGIGKQWIKKHFPMKSPMKVFLNPADQTTIQFIPATLEDNPILMKGDPTYGLRLENMADKHLGKALRYGDWSGMEGQFFDEFYLERGGQPYHRTPEYWPGEDEDIGASCDWGYDPDAFSYQLHAIRKVSTSSASFLRITTFAKIYGHRKHPKEWAEEIKQLEAKLTPLQRERLNSTRFADPSMFNKDPKGGSSVAEEFEKAGVRFNRANNDHRQGWKMMRVWLSQAPDGLPYWQIAGNCHELLNQIPEAVRNRANASDIEEGMEDHALVCARYFLISRPHILPRPISVIKEIRAKALTPTSLLDELRRKSPVLVGQFSVKE